MSFSIEGLDELRKIGVNMGKIASKALPEVDAIVKKGAHNIKEDMIEDIKASKHFSSKKGTGLQNSISYDSQYGVGKVQYVIGPDKSRAPGGALGNIYYFGTSRGGGSGDLEGPMNREAPELAKHLGDLLGDLGGRL